MDICWRTKNNDLPTGKPKVYLSCYGPDWKHYGEKLIEQLHSICDCAVYYYPPAAQPDDAYRFDLARMDLLVIPVTAALLCKPNRTMDFDVEFAREKHIPILPLLQEEGLEGIYSHRFGQLQFLREGDSDRTALPYREKLENFLRTVLVGNQLADKIRKAFCARIFLSYRKKDRALAQRLMELIHEDPKLQDVAIWYDEFLIPGDDFEKNISKELENSDLFLLAVTPNVLEPDNYVMTKEYPAASNALPVIPAQMLPTDREKLKRCYPGIRDPLDAYDREAREGLLHGVLRERLRADDEPYHKYLMGMAYLSGVDVEKDTRRAIELLEKAADGKVTEATEKLALLYHLGDHVPRDHAQSKNWLKRWVEIAKEGFDTRPNEESAYELFRALRKSAQLCSAVMDHRAARMYALQTIPMAKLLCEKYEFKDQILVDCYREAGSVFDSCEDHERALQYRLTAVKLEEALYRNARDMEVRLRMVDSYRDLAGTCEELEQLTEAVTYYGKALEILQLVVDIRKDPKLVRELIELHESLGNVLRSLGDKRLAKQYAKQADKLFRTYKNELQKGGLMASMSAASYYLTRHQKRKATKMMEKAIVLSQKEIREQSSFENRQQLALAYSMLGVIWEIRECSKKARAYYLLSDGIYRELAEEYPCPQMEYARIDGLASLGSTYDNTWIFEPEEVFYSDYSLPKRDLKNAEQAYGYYEKALQLLQQVDTDRSLPEHQKKEAELLEAVGRLSQALGRKEQAVLYCREYRQLCDRLRESLRSNVSSDRYADACFRLAMLTLERDLMEEAYRIWSVLAVKNPNYMKKKKEAWRLLNL